ncbi:MAG: hypothetical protein PHO37_08685 [Kiritimatiellae bacterium]|nr:hypothetical protein [Kiritimatiellia bacterium]
MGKKSRILVGLVVFAVAVLYVFFPVLGKYAGLHAPDSMPFFTYKYSTVVWANLLGGEAFTPQKLYWLIFHPLHAHELTYIIDTLIIVLGAFYYLRGRKVSPLAAWCGALALGFSGYTFTLFCAGHRGYFHMFSSVIWSFGLLDRGFRSKRLFYFAMLGMVFAWGIVYQPDVLLLLGVVAGIYALWLSWISPDGFKSSAIKVWPRFLVSLLLLGLAGFGGIHAALTTQVANRKAQIAGKELSSKAADTAPPKSEAEVAQAKKEQWLFATNWSLPPEDMLELIVPGIFGNESFHGSHPYWGRLGQPHKSVFQKGRMMPNYRQHTVYLGVIAVVFAFFAVFVWLQQRKKPTDEEGSIEHEVYRDVPFWIGVWIVCLILAMGRFTPFYRLFYAIPYMDLIRAPVKFLHLVEIASAMLCGFGVHAFLTGQRNSEKVRSGLVWIAAVAAGVLVVVALVFMAGQSAVTQHLKALGLAQQAEGAAAYALRNIGRSLLFLVPVIAAAWWLRRADERRWLTLFGGTVMILMVCDQALVARRYVKSLDLVPYYRENLVVKALKRDAAGSLPRVLNYSPQSQSGQDWFRLSLGFNGIQGLMPGATDVETPYTQLFTDLEKNPRHLWQALHVKYLILPHSAAAQLVQSRSAQPLLSFELGAGVVRQTSQPGEQTLVLLALNGVNSQPRLVTSWQGGVAAEDQVQQVASSKLVVSDAATPLSPSANSDAKVELLFEQSIPGAYSIGVKTSASADSLLIFDQRVSEKNEVLVDGMQMETSVADGVWIAVKIPAGEHEVVLRAKRKSLPFILSAVSMLFIAAWGGLRILTGDQAEAT